MRIIAGKYRGKNLKEFNISTTKPTLDRVKESIFSLIQFDIDGATVCDLFSGTGAFGLEAVSRGAEYVAMVDNNPQAINLIKQNAKNIVGNYKIFNMDYLSFLKQNNKFDLFLLDPPYAQNFGLVAIDYIIKNNLLNPNGTIIFETSAQNDVQLNYPNINVDKRKYGSVAVYKITN